MEASAWLGEALSRVLSGEAAERVLDRVLRAGKLSRGGRQAVAEALFGVGLWRRTLGVLVGREASAGELLFALLHGMARVPAGEAASLAGLASPIALGGVPSTLAERWSLPDWLARHLTELVGEEADALAASLAVPAPIFLRVNTLKTTREALIDALAQEGVATCPTRFSPVGLEVVGPRPNILGLSSHRAGHFEVQDEGSQLLGVLVDAQPGERVLDLCAGAGGKSLQLAAQLQGEGRLDVWDLDPARLGRLRTRAERAGALRVRVLSAPPVDALYDRVLIDAPCSELGTLRRGPDLRWRLTEGVLTKWVETQRALLDQGASLLKPGGRLVYATCTLNPLENEVVVRSFLSRHSAFSLVAARVLADSEGFFRSLPHRDRMDGFFAGIVTRSSVPPR